MTTPAFAPVDECLRAASLEVGYGTVPAITDVDVVVRAGEFVALLGPNGAGKTTLLRTLAGVLQPSGGSVELHGTTTTAPCHGRARLGLGYLGDDRHVFPGLTVEQNLRLVPEGHRALDWFPELDGLRRRRAGLLSGGEQQMLALGRCLAGQPTVVVVDELSLGLAPLIRDRLLDILRTAADAGTAVLVVEQDAGAVLQRADRAYVLVRGLIADERRADEWIGKLDDLAAMYLR